MKFVIKAALILAISINIAASESDIKAAIDDIANNIYDEIDKNYQLPESERVSYLQRLLESFQQEIVNLERSTDEGKLKSEHIRILKGAIITIRDILPSIEQQTQKEMARKYRKFITAKTSNASILLQEGIPANDIDFILREANNFIAYVERLNIRAMYPQDFIYAERLPGQDVMDLLVKFNELSKDPDGPDKIDNFIQLEQSLEEQKGRLSEIADDRLREKLHKDIDFNLEVLRYLKDDLIRRERTKVEVQKRRLESERRRGEGAAAAPAQEMQLEPEIIPITNNKLEKPFLQNFIDSLHLDNKITDSFTYSNLGYIFINPVCKNKTNQYIEINRQKYAQRKTSETSVYAALHLNQGEPQEIEARKEIVAQYYKIHITIKPEYVLWVVKFLLDKFNNGDFCDYDITDFKAIIDLEHFQLGERIFPTIVIYTLGYESAQAVYDQLKWLNKLSNLSPGYFMRHNLGGPVVWWAGGDADVKPAGAFYNEQYTSYMKDFLVEDPEHPGSYPYFKFQRPLNG